VRERKMEHPQNRPPGGHKRRWVSCILLVIKTGEPENRKI
jgi:hypothetical protein